MAGKINREQHVTRQINPQANPNGLRGNKNNWQKHHGYYKSKYKICLEQTRVP